MNITKKQALRKLKYEMGGYREVASEETCESLEKQVEYYREKYKKEKNKINKAIEFLEKHVIATETEDTLIRILRGED